MARVNKLSIVLPTIRTGAPRVIAIARNVINGMTEHVAIYPAPTPTVAALVTALDELVAADVPFAERNINSSIVLQQKKVVVIDLLSSMSNYVLLIANGDRPKAALSGFGLNKENTTNHTPSQFGVAFDGAGPDGGTAYVRITERAGNALFIVQLLVEDKWVMIDAFNTLRFLVKGLPSGASTLRIYGKKGEVPSPSIDLVVRAS